MIWWMIFLFVIGILLILSEFVLPGLICGILGGIAIGLSCLIAIYFHPEHALLIIVAELICVTAAIVLGFFVVARSPLGRAMVLSDTQNADAGWVSDTSDESLLGATGQVYSALRPAGTILVRDKKINAVSTGDFIEDGAWVRVVEVNGNRVVVEPAAQG
ncbi:MAG: NfeD family protein [Candidatus Hydrogenedentes bacterium]|nr:NfeD family protein [Candidatus Hydrogenedentota bacterium]